MWSGAATAMPAAIRKTRIRLLAKCKNRHRYRRTPGDASLFGGAARVSKDGDWSESYICNLFDWHLKEQETMPWLNRHGALDHLKIFLPRSARITLFLT